MVTWSESEVEQDQKLDNHMNYFWDDYLSTIILSDILHCPNSESSFDNDVTPETCDKYQVLSGTDELILKVKYQ